MRSSNIRRPHPGGFRPIIFGGIIGGVIVVIGRVDTTRCEEFVAVVVIAVVAVIFFDVRVSAQHREQPTRARNYARKGLAGLIRI